MSRLASAFRRQGNRFSIALLDHAEDPQWEKSLPGVVQVAGIDPDSALKRHLPSTLRFAREWLRTFRPDAVLGGEPASVAVARIASVGLSKRRPHVLSWFHGDLRELRHACATALCDGHLAISSGVGQQLRDKWDRPTTVVYNPSDDDCISPCPRPCGDTVRLLYIGRLHEQKRVDRVLEALALVPARNWTLQVVGDGEDRPMLEECATRLGLADRVVWCGWHQRPWDEVAEASLLLLTSRMEGFPVLLVEAIARGVPVAAMDCDFGPREIIEPGKNGWLVPQGDTTALAGVIARVCDSTAELPSPQCVLHTSRRFRPTMVAARINSAVLTLRMNRH